MATLHRRFIILTALFLLVPSGAGYTQDVEDRGDFFSKGFADRPDLGVEIAAPTPRRQLVVPSPNPTVANDLRILRSMTPIPVPKKIIGLDAMDGSGSKSAEVIGKPPEVGVKIERLSLVVNAADREHLSRVIDELFKKAEFRELQIGTVYRIASDAGKTGDNLSKRLEHAGGKLIDLPAPPTQLDIKVSPAWIFETAKGDYIVEGAIEINKFVNADGEFIAPVVQKAPTRRPEAMEGF